jgi:antitoxin component YwqK of YwqJK toxin-antitoxin module
MKDSFKRCFILVLCLVLASCAAHKSDKHELSCIQITDRNGFSETISSKERLEKFNTTDFLATQPYKQVFRLFNKDQKGQANGLLTSYHPNGQIFQYLEVINSRANGVYKEWHFNGQIKIEADVIGGPADLSAASQKQWLFDGLCKVWDERGELVSEISYKKGSLDGKALYYYPNGTLKRVTPYVQNEISGEQIEYLSSGKLYCKMNFEEGKREGSSLTLWDEEKLASVEEYKDDLLVLGQYFDKSGVIISEIQDKQGKKAIFQDGALAKLVEYKKGIAEGKVDEFSGGILKRTYFLRNGEKDGEEIEFYPPNEKNEFIKKLSFYWDSGIINGVVKSWYQDGKLESQKEIKKNKKDGVSCAWYKNGKVMLVEEYEDDVLVNGKYYKCSVSEPISTVVKGNGLATLFDGDGSFLSKVKYSKGKIEE